MSTSGSPQLASRVPTTVKPQQAVTTGLLQRKCACGTHTTGGAQCEECKNTARLQRKGAGSHPGEVPASVYGVLRSSGNALDSRNCEFFESRMGSDFGRVRLHTDSAAADSASAVNASAYTVGHHVVFGRGRYQPDSSSGRELLAHELAHVTQQRGASIPASGLRIDSPHSVHEASADHAAARALSAPVPKPAQPSAPVLQRRVEMRDVGRGEQSGFARLPELIDRLNAASGGLTFSMDGGNLAYEITNAASLTDFDNQMMGFIDQEIVIPMRLTNHQGLLGTRDTGYHQRVIGDDWQSGYVDIDDLLASSDLALQLAMIHILRERSETRNYARRIGSSSMRGAAADREFDRAHARGIDSEVALLRDFFGDPTIRFVREIPTGSVARIYRNERRDIFRLRERARRSVEAYRIDVVTPDRVVHTPEEYLRLREEERIREQVERERLGGADEHRAGGRGVPAP
jgi:hypothetical protein